MRYLLGLVPRQEAIPLITKPLEKALELDNTLAGAHVTLGEYRMWLEWDWEGAEKAFQQALRLNPNYPDYGVYLLCFMGRAEEALPHLERSLELNPLDPGAHFAYGQVLGAWLRRWDDAEAAFRTALEIEPNFIPALGSLGHVFEEKGMYDEALAIVRKIWAYDAERTKALEDGFEKAGYKGAHRAVADLEAAWHGKPGKSVTAMDIATNYRKAGDYDLVIDWLEKAYEEHNLSLPYITGAFSDPLPLRSDPRFQNLLRKMNLPVDEQE
jgi:hypothetical protein